jgi:hypothetical protein
MASRSKPDRRTERGGDSMEALKPLIVLVLFGTILYGGYTVVQKGPSKDAGSHASAPEAPAFAPPAVEVPLPAAQADATAQAAPPALAPAMPPAVAPAMPPALAATAAPTAPMVPAPPFPVGQPPSQPLAATPPPPPAAAAAAPPTAPDTVVASQLPTDPAVSAGAAGLVAGAAAATGVALAADAATPPAMPGAAPQAAIPPAAQQTPLAEPAAPASAAPTTYLAAESAPPPAQDDVLAPPAVGDAGDRPDRLASLPQPQPPASLPPEMPPPPGTLPSSAAFATAWADAHEKLTAGRYAEALAALSVWYDDPSLGLEESHRLEDLLGQLAGTVIYSQQDLLLPPHVVAPGETLPAIAASLGVSWQLLAKINGVEDPMQLIPGEHLKVVRGPFDAVVSVARRRVSLQMGGAYAGSFPVMVGREFLPRVGGALPVQEVRRGAAAAGQPGPGSQSPPAIVLADGLVIQPADDPAVVSEDAAPTSLTVSARDFAELADILGPGSSVLVRQ